MKIILLRHGKTNSNRDRIFSTENTRLIEEAYPQLDRTRENLKNFSFSKVYTSQLLRSQETAKYLGFDNFTVDKRVNELDFGDFKGVSLEKTHELFPETYEKLAADPLNTSYPNGESIMDVYKRVSEFLDEKAKEGEDILVVSHGIAIRTSIMRVLNDFSNMKKFWLENGSLTVYSYENGKKMIQGVNIK